MPATILVVDDQESIRHFLAKALEREGHTVVTAATGAAARARLAEEDPDVAILDLNLPDASGLGLLAEIKSARAGLPVVIITAHGDVETAVAAMKAGAFDYVPKPVNLEQLSVVIEKALSAKRVSLEIHRLREARGKDIGLDFVATRSPAMRRVLDMAVEVAASETTGVLIEGESGTGKEVVANLIHRSAANAAMPFLEMNCASLPEKLLESELFGHEKGAFTDATNQKRGLLELADRGTLFLDEVGEMSPEIQVKFLRVLERMSFKRVGGTRDISVRVRVIAATNRELAREVDNGRFRSDLYYRLKVVPLTLPPLRERAEDILPLAHHFRERFNKTFGKNFSLITPAAEQRLVEHPWPGNIRELKNLLERTILLGKGEAIDVEHLALEPARRGAGNGRPAGGHPVLSDVETLLLADIPTSGIRLESIVEEIERAAILKASEQTGWNQTRTSALLGINRDKLRYRMKVYGISRDREEAVGHSID